MLADLIPKLAAMGQDEHHPYYPRPSLASPATQDNPGRCVRAMTYARLGTTPAPWPGRFLLVLDDSSWHEELTLDWLAKGAYTIHSRQMAIDLLLPRPVGRGGHCRTCDRPIPNTVLHGHIDALFTDLFGIDYLLEHKAINHFTFQEVLEGHPLLDHLTQGCLYLAGLRHLTGTPLEGLLLYKNKNTSAYCEFRFTYDHEADRCHVTEMVASEGIHQPLTLTFNQILANAIAKFDEVELYATQDQLPPRPYRIDSWRCDYCLFSNRCWDGYLAEVAGRNSDTLLDPPLDYLLKEYAQGAASKRDGEAITKRLRPQILAALEVQHTKRGTANGYRATVTVQDRTSIDESLLPVDIKEAASTTKPVETLRVSAITNNHASLTDEQKDA